MDEKEGNKEKIIMTIIIIIILAGAIFTITSALKTPDNNKKQLNNKNKAEYNEMYETKTAGTTMPGDVEIELTPHKPEENQIKIDFAANTHSVDLSKHNLKEITTLIINDQEIKPISAPTMRGHHNSGTIIFPISEGEKIKSFTIIIKNIPKEDKIFRW